MLCIKYPALYLAKWSYRFITTLCDISISWSIACDNITHQLH